MTKRKLRPPDGIAHGKTDRPLPIGAHPDRLTRSELELRDGRYLIAYGRPRPDA